MRRVDTKDYASSLGEECWVMTVERALWPDVGEVVKYGGKNWRVTHCEVRWVDGVPKYFAFIEEES